MRLQLVARNLLLRLVSIIHTVFVQPGQQQVATPHHQPPFAVTRKKSLPRRLSRRYEGGD
jgi:hypothetical protein